MKKNQWKDVAVRRKRIGGLVGSLIVAAVLLLFVCGVLHMAAQEQERKEASISRLDQG